MLFRRTVYISVDTLQKTRCLYNFFFVSRKIFTFSKL